MSKKIIKDNKIEEHLLTIVDSELKVTIRKATELLEERYGIKISPQIVKRYLLKLVKDKKILED